MTAIENVKRSDRFSLISQYASVISEGKMTIGSLIGKTEDVAECKRHFADFYGESNIQHTLAHTILNIMIMIERSIDKQGEEPNKKISQWSKTASLRMQLSEKIRVLTTVGA